MRATATRSFAPSVHTAARLREIQCVPYPSLSRLHSCFSSGLSRAPASKRPSSWHRRLPPRALRLPSRPPPQPPRAQKLLGIAAWNQLVGNSISGKDGDETLVEYYAPDG